MKPAFEHYLKTGDAKAAAKRFNYKTVIHFTIEFGEWSKKELGSDWHPRISESRKRILKKQKENG